MKKYMQLVIATLFMMTCLTASQAQKKNADRMVSEKFMFISGNSAIASRVVFYQTAAIVQSINSLMQKNGYPIDNPTKFWEPFNPEMMRMSTPHFANVQKRFVEYVQNNFTDEELKAIIKFYESGAGKKYGELWTRAEFMDFYFYEKLAEDLYAKALTYAKKRRGVNKPLSAER